MPLPLSSCLLRRLPVVVLGFVLNLALAACGSDKSAPPPAEPGPLKSGMFADHPVEGLEFSSGSAPVSLTDRQGTFSYRDGTPVRFAIGGIALGSEVAGAVTVTPLQLAPGAADTTDPRVTNMARLLQTLDADCDVSNGIRLTPAVRSAGSGRSIDFDQTEAAFGSDTAVQNFLEAAGAGCRDTAAPDNGLVSGALARQRLGETLTHMESNGGRANRLPVALAGADFQVNEGAVASLAGAGADDDGSVTDSGYRWTQLSGPAVISGPVLTASFNFAAPAVEADTPVTLRLRVTDDDDGTHDDDLTITIRNGTVNDRPIADAGADQTVNETETVTLNGANSRDPEDGVNISYQWTQAPDDPVAVTLSGADGPTPAFTAPVVAAQIRLHFTLIVRDSQNLASAPDTVTITVNNVVGVAPVADAGPDRMVDEGAAVTLDGTDSTDSTDPDGSITGFDWTQTAGAPVMLTGANTATPSFAAPDVVGDEDLTFRLTVTDNHGDTDNDSVTVRVLDRRVISIGSPAPVIEGDVGLTEVSFTVRLTLPAVNPVTVEYTTQDVTATAGRDYVAASGTLEFQAGEDEKTVTVNVIGDVFDENDETFRVLLFNATGASLGASAGAGTILDDDDKGLLRAGAAKRSITPCDQEIAGVCKNHIAGVDEPRIDGTTHLQRFHLGGFGTEVTQNVSDPIASVGRDVTNALADAFDEDNPIFTQPAEEKVFSGSHGAEDTHVRAMVLEQPGGARVAFVMIDAIGAGNIIQRDLKAAVMDATKLCDAAGDQPCFEPENILFGQTHSHAGADLQGLWGGVPQDWIENILYERAAEAVADAIRNLRPARLRLRQGQTLDYNIHRRQNLDGDDKTDGTLTLLRATADDGTPIGSILQYNAHPTTINEGDRPRRPHADYIQGAMDLLESAATGPGGVGLYYNGPIADARPSCPPGACPNGSPDGKFTEVRLRGEGIASTALSFDGERGERELLPTLGARHELVVLPVTNPLFLAAGLIGSFNRYYDFLMLPKEQIEQIQTLGPLVAAEIVNLPQLTPVATTNVSRITIGGATGGLEVVTIPGEATNTFGQYIRGLATTDVMLLGLTQNSFGYIIPEEEFNYLNPGHLGDENDAFSIPFTSYEEFVSLGPLTAPLLRLNGYNPLFDIAECNAAENKFEGCNDPRNLPPSIRACMEDPLSEDCALSVIGRRIDFIQRANAQACRNFGGAQAEPICALIDPETPFFQQCLEAGLPEDTCRVFGTGNPDTAAEFDQALSVAAADALARGCDILDPAHCLFPFPSDHFTVKAAAGSPQARNDENPALGGTGLRINFNPLAMPRNTAGKPVDPSEWNRNDGYSPGQMILTYVPGLAANADGTIPGLPSIKDVSPSLDDSVLVLDAETGEPHPVWAETDLNAGMLLYLPAREFTEDPADDTTIPNPKPKRAALIIRPAKNFEEGRRYIVVLRNLKNAKGEVLPAQLPFRVCRDGEYLDSMLPPVQSRCAALEPTVFDKLPASIDRSELYLAWDFTVASTNNQVARLRQMRDDAFVNYLGQTEDAVGNILHLGRAPQFAVTETTDFTQPKNGVFCDRDGIGEDDPPTCHAELTRSIRGRFTVPSYVVPADPSPLDGTEAYAELLKRLPPEARSFVQSGGLGIFEPAEVSSPPNRLFYNPADAVNPNDPQGLRYGDGLPDRSGEMTTTFTCRIARSTLPGKTFNDPTLTAADVVPARPSLYGHGLLGNHSSEINQDQLRLFGNEHNMMFCATDWFGFASGDLPNVVSLTLDVSNFPVLPDGTQQGILNQMVLARLLRHLQGFASDPAFQVEGRSVFTPGEVYYDGNSQGGITGGAVVALSKDIRRGVLGVPGMNYSTLLTRSVDFDLFSVPLYASYPDDLDRSFLFSMMQMLWDRSENNGYAPHMTKNGALHGPNNEILLHPAFGDHQVTMWSAYVMANTIGAPADDSRINAAREDVDLYRPARFGVPALAYDEDGRAEGSGLMLWDAPWTSSNRNCLNKQTISPPFGNVPPRETTETIDTDPHECPRREAAARCQKSHFLNNPSHLVDVSAFATVGCPALDTGAEPFPGPEGDVTSDNGTGLIRLLADFMQHAGDFVAALLTADVQAAFNAVTDALAQLAANLAHLLVGADGSLLAALENAFENLQNNDPMAFLTDFLSDLAAILGLQADPVTAAQTTASAERSVEPVVLTGASLPAWSAPAAVGVANPYPSGTPNDGTGLFPRPFDARGDNVRSAHNGRLIYPAEGQAPAEGMPVNEIAAYRFAGVGAPGADDNGFVEIPVQVDERMPYFLANARSNFSTYSGTDPELNYVWDSERWDPIGDGCTVEFDEEKYPTADPVPGLDNDDEIVFMAKDAGGRAPAGAVPAAVAPDAASHEVALLNPLRNPDSGQPDAPRFIYLFHQPAGSAFGADNGYVRYARDLVYQLTNAPGFDFSSNHWVDSSFFTDDDLEKLGSDHRNYGPNLTGNVCRDGVDPRPSTVRGQSSPAPVGDRFPLDGVTVTTDTYRWRATGRWMVRDIRVRPEDGFVALPGGPVPFDADDSDHWDARADLLDRWKGRAFQQNPDSYINAIGGFEDEQVNWEANSILLGERMGPVRAIREVWGADSGTNVTKTETFYRDAVTYRYRVRVHPIPPDGLYTSWDYNRGAMVPTAEEAAAGIEGGRYFTQLRPQGVPVDGVNDDVGNVDGVVPLPGDQCVNAGELDNSGRIDEPRDGRCPMFFDTADPTFNLLTGFYNWEQVSGKGDLGSLVYLFEIKGETSLGNPLVVPYYRDDACFDDGTGDDPVGRPFPGRPGFDADIRQKYSELNGGRPYEELRCEQKQGAHGSHGVHYFFTHDTDNAFSPATSTETDGQQWQFMVPTERPTNIAEPYANVVRAPLKAVAFPRGGEPGFARELFRNYPSLLACVQSQDLATCQAALEEILDPAQVEACQPFVTNPDCLIGPAFSAALMALDDQNQQSAANSQAINPDSAGNGIYNIYLPTASGEILAFTVFEPTEIVSGETPLVLHGHGYGGSRTRTRSGFISTLNSNGYAVISFDQRGFGESSGTVRVLDPDVEGQDLVQMVDWAEDNLPWLKYDGGNLVLGSIGSSYGGGYQLLLLAVDPKQRLDALVPDITWNDLRSSLDPGRVVKSGWDLLLPVGGESGSQGQQDPFIKEALLYGVATNSFPENALEWFNYHSANYFCEAPGEDLSQRIDVYDRAAYPDNGDMFPGSSVARSEQPPVNVLLTQGFRDTLFNFNQAYANYRCLSAHGGDVRLLTHQSGHIINGTLSGLTPAQIRAQSREALVAAGYPQAGSQSCGDLTVSGATLAWFDEKLKGGAAADIPEICLSLADGVAIEQTAVTVGGTLFPVPLTRGIPNGVFALPEANPEAGPVVIELGTVGSNETVLAGIPTASLTISHFIADPPAADPIIFVGVGVQRAGTDAWTYIDDQVQPFRGLGPHNVQLVGIAERLDAGDKLALLVSGFHIQYPESWSRDATTPAVNIEGSVKLPIIAGNVVPASETPDSLADCLQSFGAQFCAAILPGLAEQLATCEYADAFEIREEGDVKDYSAPNCAYNAVYDAIGIGDGAAVLGSIVDQCADSDAAELCEQFASTFGTPDRLPLAAELLARGTLASGGPDSNVGPTGKLVGDGTIADWTGTASRIGGTALYHRGEHIYSDYLFDAYGADDGDDARRLAALLVLAQLNSRTGRIDQLFQAAGDQFGAPEPVGMPDHYGDAADLEEGADLTEVRWASDGASAFFLARVTRLFDPAKLVVLVLADRDPDAFGMSGLDASLTTGRFDRAFLLRSTGSTMVDLLTGAEADLPAGDVAVRTADYDNAIEARLDLVELAGGGQINVAVLTLIEKDGRLTPANLAYRFDEPVAGIYNERNQALALHAGNVDAFTATIDVASLTSGLTQNRVPGSGYHERQFISGDNISIESEKEQGRLQHYGLYVPTLPDLDPMNRVPLTIWVHYRGGKAHSGGAWTPRLIHQLGEEQGNIVVTPRGRGTSTWYTHWAHQDVFEVFADIAGTAISGADTLPLGHPLIGSAGLFDINPDRVYLSGYSMGGFGTYLFGLLYPDKFAAGFAQSGATTQGAWTGVGPDGPFCPPGANPCFVETNEGKANAQLNWRLLENARHFPITIHHGSNDELVPITGVQRFGERLLELGYRYDLTMFLGYEHFTQAIVDEWADGAHYLNQFSRPENPRRVTYKVVPALVDSVRELSRAPAAIDAPLTHINPDGAYWVDDLLVRTAGVNGFTDNTADFGQIDAESEALEGDEIQAIPTSQTSFLPPYLSTPVFSPGNHSTPYVRHGQDWQVMAALPKANRFRATLTNLSAATLYLDRMNLDFTKTIEGALTNDNPGPDLTTVTLANVGDKMTLCVGNDPGVNVGPGSATGSNPTVELGNGMKGVWLAPDHDRICADVIGFNATPGDVPDYADLCESYGIDPAALFCASLRTAEEFLVGACDAENTPAGMCTLFGGNLHALLDTCFANNPGEEDLPMCRVMDAFVTGAAAYCRQVSTASGGAQAPELCALMGGVLVSEKALQAYENSWVHKALLLQNKLGYGLPLLHNTLLHTHNSFNATDDNTPPTLSGSDYNQLYDVTGQLRMDIRAIEIDVHWMPGRDGTPETGGFEPMVCHADTADRTEDTPFEEDPAGTDHRSPHLGCTVEKPLREVLGELRFWLDQHPSEAVVLYLEDHLTEAEADTEVSYETTSQVIEDALGDLVYRTGASDCDNADPTSWLRNVTRREIIETGMQVFLISETCNSAGTWNSLVHRKRGDNVRQGTQSSFDGFSYEANCALPDDAMDDGIRIPDQRRVRWSRIWEDSTMVTATAGGGAPAALTPAVTHELMRCGLSLPGFDRLYPADPRLDAAVWSWAKNEPAADAAHANNCAKLNTDGRFEAANCGEERPYACVAGNLADGITDPNDWEIVGSGMWDDGAAACIGVDRLFSVPGNGYANEKLKDAKAAIGITEVWLNYSDKTEEGVWEGSAVGGTALRASASFRTEVGLLGTIAGFLSDMTAAAAALFNTGFEAFADAVASSLERFTSNLFGVLIGNETSSVTGALERLLGNIRQLDSENVARDFARDLIGVLSGDTRTVAVRAGVGVVDMTPDVGYCSGQYCDIAEDWFDGAAGGDFDPYLTHKTKRKSDGVQSRLTARAIVVEGSNGKRIALLKTDNYLAQDNLMRRVGQILADNGSTIRFEQILHHVTHNHTAAYSSTLTWGPWLFEDAYDARFFENQARRMAEAILIAEVDLKPARMGATTVRHTIFKGNVVPPTTADDGTPAGHPREYGDHGLVVMRFDEVDGQGDFVAPIAVWVNWGEHPESLDGPNMHSADFLAGLERFVERDIGVALVFSQGDVGSAERSGNAGHQLRDDGTICNDGRDDDGTANPAETCPSGEGVWRDWDHKGFVQTERNVRYLADAIVKGWKVIGGELLPDSDPAAINYVGSVQVPLSGDFVVDHRHAWVPGPLSHPYPAVSNCRSEPTVEGDTSVPLIGGPPDCERVGFPGDNPVNAQLAMIVNTMKVEGVPVPDHYDVYSHVGLEENNRLYLQTFRLGEVLLASCACEAQADLILNLESRADTAANNIYDGLDWVCIAEDKGLVAADPTFAAACDRQREIYDVAEFDTNIQGSGIFTTPSPANDALIAHMRAQVHNKADGWDAPDYVHQANSEPPAPEGDPTNFSAIKGNFTREEIQDLGASGYTLPVGVGHAGDYNGYTVSYREFMNRDHYRKSLTSYGPHTADYMVTRLVRLAAAMKGGPEMAPEPHDAFAQADEARQVALSQLHGQATASAFDAFHAALPLDFGPMIVDGPVNITRFQAATFTWRGGSTAVDNPDVRVQREIVPDVWLDAYDMTGEVQTRVHWPQGIPDTLPAYAGRFEWLWTANFEAYSAFPHRLGSTPLDTYRFVVDGRVKEGAGFSAYQLVSQQFNVTGYEFPVTLESVGGGEVVVTIPLETFPVQDAAEAALFPYILAPDADADTGSGFSPNDNGRFCEQCGFRPWARTLNLNGVEVSVNGGDRVPAVCELSGGAIRCTAIVGVASTDVLTVFDRDDNFGDVTVP